MDFSSRVSTTLVHEPLIEAYFVAYNASYPVLHEQTFRDESTRRLQTRQGSTWHIIHYMVLAIGEWVSGFGSDEQSLYYEAARARVGVELLESGSLQIVQAFLLLGNYLQKRDRPNTGYNYIGLAHRVAVGLGLHRETASSVTGSFQQHRRRQIFWTLYCFESGFGMTTGRPTLMADVFIDAQKPANVDDSLGVDLQEVSYPTTSSAIAAQARLAVIGNEICSTLVSARAPMDIDQLLAVMEHRIQSWKTSLPKYFAQTDVPSWFRGPRQVLLWREANIRLLLLLSGLRNQAGRLDAIRAKCQDIASETIDDIASFCRTHHDIVHTGLSWYATYFLLQATLAFGVSRVELRREQSIGPLSEHAGLIWENVYLQACQCLRSLGRQSSAAVRALQLLERLHKPLTRTTNSEADHGISIVNEDRTQTYGDSELHRRNIPTDTRELGQQSDTGYGTAFEPSPNAILATDFVEGSWVNAVDPSLHVFFDHIDDVGSCLDGFQLPSAEEQDVFAYMTSGFNTMRGPSTHGA